MPRGERQASDGAASDEPGRAGATGTVPRRPGRQVNALPHHSARGGPALLAL